MKNNSGNIIDCISLGYRDAFVLMMKSTADSIYFKDKQSRFICISDTQLRRLNKTDLKEVIGKTDFDFFSKEHATKAYNSEQEIIKTGCSIIDEEEHTVFANGEVAWSKVSKYPLYDQNKNIVGTWGISTDITKQKEVELRIKEREARYHLLSDITIEGIVIHENGIIIDSNPSLVKMLGYSQKETLGKHVIDFVSPDDKKVVEKNINKDSESSYKINLVKKSGELFAAEIESKTIKIHGSNLRMAAIRDMTKRKQAEDALRDSEMRMRSITDSAYDAILMMDPEGNISYWNPAAERIFGYSSNEALGENLHRFIVPKKYHKAHDKAFPKFVKTGEGKAVGKTLDMTAIRKDKTKVFVQLSLSAVKMSSGWHSIGIIRDVTEQKQSEEELMKAKTIAEEATKAKSEFLANMSHEIRTPMNAVIGFAGLMKKTELTAKQQDYINKIDSSAKSLLGIINDILDFSKMEAGKLKLEDVDFHLDDVLDNIMNMNSNKAAEKDIELINSIGNNVPRLLRGDPLRLGQILLNLVNNAVKFTEKGHVMMKTELIKEEEHRCQIKFSVIDTGIGLTNGQKNKLFSAFSQADSSVTRRFGGTGLGLTISKRLVEMMKGKIDVQSEFGTGSTFSVLIDFVTQAEDECRIIYDTEKLRDIKVLIVDDNEMARDILKEQVGAFGINALGVASGSEAIFELRKESLTDPYDLVILDWRMPEMDGIEVAKKIMSDKKIKYRPKIILVSAFGRDEVVKQAEKIGVNTFLMKPINQSLLLDTIMNMFELDMKDIPIRCDVRENEDTNNRIDGFKILLVEDNIINQEVAIEILSSAGANVEIANNGKEAVKAVKTKNYDVVLMDLQMPVMGGYEATKLIREDAKNKKLPIIAMTAHAMQGVKEDCIAAGMNDYVSKPIDPNGLFSTIRKWAEPIYKEKTEQQAMPDAIEGHEKKGVELPDSIPGVDIQAGISRLNGNVKLYKKLLVAFGSNYSSCSIDIRKSIENNNVEDAMRHVHTLKGVAGNISANDIHDIAQKLELELSKEAAENYDILLNNLDTALKSLNAIVSGLGDEAKPEVENNEKIFDLQEVEPVLRELAHLVWEDNIDAENTLEELKKLCGSRFTKEMALITKSIENFDFEAAKLPLNEIAKKINIKLEGEKNE